MEKTTRDWRLTRRGWIVLVIIPAILAIIAFTYATRDVCWVGIEHGNALGYGSCQAMMDRFLEGGNR